MVGFTCFSFKAAREVGCPGQKGRGRTDSVFYCMMRREIQVSVCMGWLPIHINNGNTNSSGNHPEIQGNNGIFQGPRRTLQIDPRCGMKHVPIMYSVTMPCTSFEGILSISHSYIM